VLLQSTNWCVNVPRHGCRAWVVHLTGENDPDADTMKHPQYFPLPFYDNMAGLLQRAN